MGLCPGNFPIHDFWEDLAQPVTVIRNGHRIGGPDEIVNGWSQGANAYANTLTGYFSDKAACNGHPQALPGKYISPLVWESYCQGVGVKRELTLMELWGNSCGAGAADFCNSITDRGDNKRRPIACGGTDPNVSTYNPGTVANEEAASQLDAIKVDTDEVSAELIASTRKKVFTVVLVVVVVVVIVYLILSL